MEVKRGAERSLRAGTKFGYAARKLRPTSAALPALLFVILSLLPTPARSQGVRGWVGSTVQMVEMRPLAVDTVSPDRVTEVDGVPYIGGRRAFCATGLECVAYRALPTVTSVAATQDVSLTAWGFGIRGLSFTTLLRGRARMGSDFLWPRTDDRFDALLAYAQWVRGPLRVRAGRQEARSGLGFSGFDGAWLSLRAGRATVEGYGGRSLARALREPAKDALRGLEDFFPDQSVYLLGGSLRAHLGATSVTARYQREILADRSGLESERASVDVSSAFPGARIRGSVDYDFAFSRFGKGHFTLGIPFADGKWLVEASARRYVPYFSLSTIWGFFEPVAYHEGTLRMSWSPGTRAAVWVSGGYRRYGDAGTTVVLEPLEDSGWRAGAGVRLRLLSTLLVDGSYRLEWGPGGYLSSGDAALRWTPREGVMVALSGTTFQQIEQFRVGDGRALGGGIMADLEISPRMSLSGGYSLMRLKNSGGAVDEPWNQNRGWTALRIRVGRDPGLSSGGRP